MTGVLSVHATRVETWLVERALPLWSSRGIDPGKGFVERLDWNGEPDLAAAKRVRVQARQIYAFSHAKLEGLCHDGDTLGMAGFDFLMRHACPEGPENGFVQSLDREGRVREARRDGYDHAFLLFALAWLFRATGDGAVRAAIDAVLVAIDARLLLDDGAIAIDERRKPQREQNPNMHLFEAMLAAFDATGEERFLERADRLHRVFAVRMFDHRTGVLREHYDVEWRPASGEAGRIVEPGHHCEWTWLLKRHADARDRSLGEEARRLAAFAWAHGCVGDLLVDQVDVDGSMRKADVRLWPQTEAIKAEVALAEADGRPLGDRAHKLVDRIFDQFLDVPVAGGWIDWFDPAGHPLVDAIPASSFYHLYLGLSEYRRALRRS